MAKRSTWRIIEDSVPQYQFAGPVGYELKDRNYLKPYIPSEAVSEQVSGFPYDEYLTNANRYLTRPVFQGTPLNAKLIADAAKEFYGKTNYVYPLELLLSQAQFETSLGKKLKSKHNYFNVGNTDSGATRDYPSAEDSMRDYMNLMYNDYLNKGQRSVESLLKPKSFVNMEGNRYASNPEYEQKLKSQVEYIKNFLSSKQVGGSKGKDKTRQPIPGAAELWQNYRNPNTVVAIGNPNNPNDTLRYFPGRPQVGGRIVVSDAEGTPVLSQENVYELMKQPNTRVYQDSTLVNKYIPKAYGGGLSKAQNGTEINPLEGDLITKVLMNRNLDKDFIQRAYALGQNPRMFSLPDPNEFGSYMSHKMSWGEDDQGQAYMFPTVMNPRNESIKVPNQYADYISSIGYKKEAGMPYKAYGGKITPESKKVRKYGPGGSTAYEAWYKYNTPEGREGFPDSYSSYDYQRYYNDAVKGVNPMGFDEGSQHFPDTYKYPWHPSFSDESIYYTNQKETPALSYNTKADWKEYLKSKRSKLKATRAKGGPVWSIVEKLPKAQMGVQLPVNPQTGMPVVNLPEVEVSPNSPWLDRHLRQLSKREDGITQLGFSDPVTIAAAAAAGIPALGIAGTRQLIGAIPGALNTNIRNVPGASINNFLNAAGITLSGSQVIDPNSAFRQSVGEAAANPNTNTLSNAAYETAFTGLGFVGMPSSMTGPIKNSFEGLAKTASYVPARLAEKAPQYINPNYARNLLKRKYPLITEESLNYIKPKNDALITNTVTGLAVGLGAGFGQVLLGNDEITLQERAQYGKLARKKRDGTISNQEEAWLKNIDTKVERITNSNVSTMLKSVGTGALFGLGLGINARNKEYFKNFMYAANDLPRREESLMATIDPARYTRLLEARNTHWQNQNPLTYNTIIEPDQRALLRRYGVGQEPLPPPPPDNDPLMLNTGYVSGSYQPDYGTPRFINLSRNEIANYVSNQVPIISYQPIINKNISQVSKDDIIPFINDNSKQKLTQLTDDEFKNTVVKPSGNLEDYNRSFNPSSHFSGDNAIIQQSSREWVDDFNSRLDSLNDIIQANNKSGINYKVTKLELEGDDYGRIFFETPAQTLADGTKIPESTSSFFVKIKPGEWRGVVQDINNKEYFQAIPGLEMSGTTQSVFGRPIWDNLKDEQKRTGIYRSLNEFMKKYDKGRVKPGFNSQTKSSLAAWKAFINKGDAVGYYGGLDPNPSWHVLYGIMKKPGGAIATEKLKNKKAKGGWTGYPDHTMYSSGMERFDRVRDYTKYAEGGPIEAYNISDPAEFKRADQAYQDSSELYNFYNNLNKRIEKSGLYLPTPEYYTAVPHPTKSGYKIVSLPEYVGNPNTYTSWNFPLTFPHYTKFPYKKGISPLKVVEYTSKTSPIKSNAEYEEAKRNLSSSQPLPEHLSYSSQVYKKPVRKPIYTPKPSKPEYNIIQHSELMGPQNMEMPRLVDYIMTPYGKMSRADYEKQFGSKVAERDLRSKKEKGGKITWQIID